MMDSQDASSLLILAGILISLLVSLRWRGFFPAPPSKMDPAADERAAALQRDVLAAGELQELARCQYLTVRSPTVKDRVYRIPARPGWVEVYEAGKLDMKLCVEPVQWLPAADIVLMHKLLIEGDEPGYLRSANVLFVRCPNGRNRVRQTI